MTHGGTKGGRTWAESLAAESSRFSLSSRRAGRIGRIREDRNAILPVPTRCDYRHLRLTRENREDSSQLYTCAGATHGNTICSTAGAPPESPDSPSASQTEALWTAFVNKEDIYAIAYRLALPPSDAVDAWRLATLRIAKSDAFMHAKPSDISLPREDWDRWRLLEASPRKLLALLRKLIYGVRIWD